MILSVKNIACFHCFKVKGQVYTVCQQKIFNRTHISRLAGAQARFASGGSQPGFAEAGVVLVVGSREATGPKKLDLDTRKKLFMVVVVRPWSRLPREDVDLSFLEAFKARLGGTLSNLIQWGGVPARGGEA